MISTQWIYRVPPLLRECSSHVAIFQVQQKRSVQALYESFGYSFKDLQTFKDFVFQLPMHTYPL